MTKALDLLPVRLILVASLAFKAMDAFFASVLTLSYRLNIIGVAERLGQLTAGDDYRRLIPLMDAIPLWVLGLSFLAGFLYLVAIVSFLWRTGWAYIPVLVAFIFEVITMFMVNPIMKTTGVVVNPNPSIFGTICIPYILPLTLAILLSRQTPRSKLDRNS